VARVFRDRKREGERKAAPISRQGIFPRRETEREEEKEIDRSNWKIEKINKRERRREVFFPAFFSLLKKHSPELAPRLPGSLHSIQF